MALGAFAGINVTTAFDVICIGTFGANVNNSCLIGHIRSTATAQNNAIPVLIDSAGQLGTVSSSRRYKEEIKAMDKTSEAILALKPVTFHYKSDNTNRPEFGLIAEEVAEVNRDLVEHDENGEIYTVRYDAVNAMLLNEFLKVHKKVQEQEATIAQLKKDLQETASHQQKQIDVLTAGLQKVSAQLELSKAAPQTVLNHR
jgi:endosialidase-like protein